MALFKVYKDCPDDYYNAFQWRPLNYTLARTLTLILTQTRWCAAQEKQSLHQAFIRLMDGKWHSIIYQ